MYPEQHSLSLHLTLLHLSLIAPCLFSSPPLPLPLHAFCCKACSSTSITLLLHLFPHGYLDKRASLISPLLPLVSSYLLSIPPKVPYQFHHHHLVSAYQSLSTRPAIFSASSKLPLSSSILHWNRLKLHRSLHDHCVERHWS